MDNLLKELIKLQEKSLLVTKPLVITDTVARTSIDAFAIYANTDTTFTTLDTSVDSNSNSITAMTLSKGHLWYIPIKGTIELASGQVIVYQNQSSKN